MDLAQVGKLVVGAITRYFSSVAQKGTLHTVGKWMEKNSVWGKAESKGCFPKLVCNKPGLYAKGCESTILRLLKDIVIGNVQFGCGVTDVS